MSAVLGSYIDDMDASYAADFGRDREPMKKRSRHPEYRRKGSAPACVNGMHCRRHKRWTWGAGRGARMTNLRAFASCVAIAAAMLATRADAQVSFTMTPIGNLGNAGNVTASGTFGSIAYDYAMATTEVTNAQYAAFLNKVDSGGTNPFGVYNSLMGSGSNGGITFTSGAAVGSKYAVRAGAPAGMPAGTSYSSMPVNYVSWFSAARFVNWLNAGQPTNSTSMNSGVYGVAAATSGSIVARVLNTSSNQYVIPSQNEWYKAAFYNGSSYTSWATNSNVAPTLTSSTSAANTANGGNVLPAARNVGSYALSKSAYGVYDMFGNIGEMTDTQSTAGSYVWAGGGYGSSTAGWNATVSPATRLSTAADVSNGFRVGMVNAVAVPEPETITLAAFGLVGLCGANWLRRKKRHAAVGALAG